MRKTQFASKESVITCQTKSNLNCVNIQVRYKLSWILAITQYNLKTNLLHDHHILFLKQSVFYGHNFHNAKLSIMSLACLRKEHLTLPPKHKFTKYLWGEKKPLHDYTSRTCLTSNGPEQVVDMGGTVVHITSVSTGRLFLNNCISFTMLSL